MVILVLPPISDEAGGFVYSSRRRSSLLRHLVARRSWQLRLPVPLAKQLASPACCPTKLAASSPGPVGEAACFACLLPDEAGSFVYRSRWRSSLPPDEAGS